MASINLDKLLCLCENYHVILTNYKEGVLLNPNSILQGFTVIMCIHFVSIALVDIFKLLLPAPLLGMIILAVLLYTNVIKINLVEPAAYLLLEYMGMLFIPPAISIILYYKIIVQEAVPIIVTLIVTTLLVMIITGKVVQFFSKKQRKEDV